MSGVDAVKTYLNMYTSDLKNYVGRGEEGTYIYENDLENGGKVYSTVAKELGPNGEPRIIKRVITRPTASGNHITVMRDTDLNQNVDIIRSKHDNDLYTTIKTKNYARAYQDEIDLPPEKSLDVLYLGDEKMFGLKTEKDSMKPVSKETLRGAVQTHLLDTYI